jgi:D-3-phosphoglycerate dehydrogenase
VAEMKRQGADVCGPDGCASPLLQDVNMVSAPMIAKERGIQVEEVRREQGIYETYIRLTVMTERQERSVAGTVFSDGKPRIINRSRASSWKASSRPTCSISPIRISRA